MKSSLVIVWVFAGVSFMLLTGLMYGIGQQILRQGANDPQIQLAEDVASALDTGTPVEAFTSPTQIDIAKSLAPYVVLFTEDGNILTSSATLHGKALHLPAGVFTYTRIHEEDRVTWQPEPGVRQAIVVRPFMAGKVSGFVVAGRSLREVEKRSAHLFLLASSVCVILVFMAGMGWWATRQSFARTR